MNVVVVFIFLFLLLFVSLSIWFVYLAQAPSVLSMRSDTIIRLYRRYYYTHCTVDSMLVLMLSLNENQAYCSIYDNNIYCERKTVNRIKYNKIKYIVVLNIYSFLIPSILFYFGFCCESWNLFLILFEIEKIFTHSYYLLYRRGKNKIHRKNL